MSAATFEAMSNDQLRQKMEEFGLPKVPITSSTRNILIKRLVNHVNGGGGSATAAAKTPAKGRRETMHVVKYSSDDDSDRDAAKEKLKKKLENHKNARRQTIGGAALSPTPPAPAPVAAEKASRKSMRATPTKSTRESGIVPPSKTIVKNIPVTIEDSEEEEEIVVPTTRKTPTRRSNTPLSKSDVVTTSYKQVVAPVREEEPIEVDDDEEEDEGEEQNSDLEDNVPLATRYSPRKATVTASTLRNYSPSVRISPIRQTALDSGSYRYTSSSKPESAIRSTFTRPSLATSPTYNTSYTSKYATRTSTANSGVAGAGDEDDFPYLREFSKRLSTLKAEPLYKRPVGTSTTSRTTTTSYSSSGRSSNYRPIIRRESHWYDPITGFVANLENKYRLKRKLLILLAILVAIFLCVMFWN